MYGHVITEQAKGVVENIARTDKIRNAQKISVENLKTIDFYGELGRYKGVDQIREPTDLLFLSLANCHFTNTQSQCLYLILSSNVMETKSPRVQVGIAHALVALNLNTVVNYLVHLLCHRQATAGVLVAGVLAVTNFVIFLEWIFLQVYSSTRIQLQTDKQLTVVTVVVFTVMQTLSACLKMEVQVKVKVVQ